MTLQESSVEINASEVRIKELTEENEALFEQLHIVQEELEKYYYKLKECEQRKGAGAAESVIVSQSPETLAENIRLHALVRQQEIALRVQAQNSLESRLGRVLIDGVRSTGSLLALPGKLRKLWKAQNQTTPPAELGGKSFQKVLDAYTAGGAEAVEKLLDAAFISHAMRANAYTALARQLMPTQSVKAASFASLAWEIDPRPYRLKWLAFREHAAGDAVTAEAMLAMLPDDVDLSDSEQRQAKRVQQESKQVCIKQAQGAATGGGQTNSDNLTSRLTKELEEHKRATAQLTRQVDQLQKEAQELRRQCTEIRHQAEERQRELQALVDQHKTGAHELRVQCAEVRQQAEERQRELQTLVDQHRAEAHELLANNAALEKMNEERREDTHRLYANYEELNKLYQMEIQRVSQRQEEVLNSVAQQTETLNGRFDKQKAEMECVRSSLLNSFKVEIDNSMQQNIAYDGLNQYFTSGKLPPVTPWKRGWSASPDFVFWMVELIEKNKYDLIIEFGSGVTTLYSAKTVAMQATKKTPIVAFDHLEQFALQTKVQLTQAGLAERAEIIHAPLQEYSAPDGITYQYYACQDKLSELSAQFKCIDSRILVIIDGPPGCIGKHARYPAFPLVMQHFAPAQIELLLDDYSRDDENEIADLWAIVCSTAGRKYTVLEKKYEKGAFLLKIEN